MFSIRNSVKCDFQRLLKSCQFCQNVCSVAFYGQYTVVFLNSIDALGDKTFRSECDLDRFLPLASKFFSMPDLPSFGYLVYITHGVD